MEIFAKRLREERTNKYSQQEMAKLLGIPYGTYKNYELTTKDGREPPFELVVKISELLDVSIDYLFGKED